MLLVLHTLFRIAAAVLCTTAAATAQPLLSPPMLPGAASAAGAAHGGVTSDATPSSQSPPDKRAENAKLLRVAQRNLEAAEPTDSAAAQQVAHYQTVDSVLAQQEMVDQQIRNLDGQRQELEQQAKAPALQPSQVGEAYSFLELDRIKDELAAEQSKAQLIDDRITAAKTALERAQQSLDDCETKRRQAQEAFEKNKSEATAGELAAAKQQAQQAATLAAELVTLRKRELARERLALEVQQLVVRRCREQVSQLSPLVRFSDADYQTQIEQIKSKEESAHRSLVTAQKRLHEANMEIREIQQQLESELPVEDRALLTEKLEAKRRARERRTDEIDSITQRLGRLAQLRVAWDRRFKIASAASPAASDTRKQDLIASGVVAWPKIKDWQDEAKAVLDELASDLRSEIFAMRTLRSSLTTIRKRIDSLPEPASEITQWLNAQQSQVEAALRIHENNLVTIETSRRVHEKLLEELGRGETMLSPKVLALGAWDQLLQIWKFEVTSINDQSIYVGKIVKSLTVFILGSITARFLSALFANRLLGRFRLSKDGTAAIRTLVFYLLLAIVALAALRTVNVPLTAFTILGGALAIGVGFGSQALINNFIGGLIMLAERPVRLGERISFGKFEGVVEDVGFRCTKLRTLTDHLVTIPNSTLVNESIENIARRRTLRRLMNVTITYDTPRQKIEEAVQAIRDILEEKGIRERIHPIVGFEEFPPRVYFNDYNAESLNIMVLYWYAPSDNWWSYVEHCERVNYRIMEEFERLGVEFAFPSRTVYVVNQTKPNATQMPHARDEAA